MANIDAPFGLRPSRYLDGTPWNGATVRCRIAAGYAVALFVGDPVLWTTALTGKDPRYPTIMVSAGTSGVIVRGVITSFEPNPDNLSRIYSPVSTAGWANVCIATPNLIFQIRDDGDGTPTAVWAGQNGLIAAGTGNTITGLSGYELDGSTTPTTTQAHTLHIVGLADIEDNELADHAIWDVIINTSQNSDGTYTGITAT